MYSTLRKWFPLVLLSFALSPASYSSESLMENGDLSLWSDASPDHWNVRSKQTITPVADGNGLEVHIDKAARGFGEILQRVVVEPNQRYRLSGKLRSSTPKLAFFQIKRFKSGKEFDRADTARSEGAEWVEVDHVFNSDGAEVVQILLRWRQKDGDVGQTVAFKDLHLEPLPPYTYEGGEVAPRAVTTFNSVGLYWKPTGGNAERAVDVHYRKKGAEDWSEALPLWFDATQHKEKASERIGEYRGSIVYLDSGTKYEVKLALQDGPTRMLEFETWSEDFKIAKTIELPADYDGKYEIQEGGNPEDGYVLYVPASGHVEWNLNNQLSTHMLVNASWVIIRGFTLKGAAQHGITLGDVNHIVIEDCDISGWGATGSDGQAININSAIYSRSDVLEHVVIQNCDLHHPRSDSNSWAEKRPGTNSSHPEGPQGISFKGGKGQYVIRHNRIYSDIDHMFNDGMGELSNISYGGFPNRDSDIHDNFVSHCWDDGLEIEGADMNVRVWNNYVDMSYGALGAAVPSFGPVYFFRNVFASSRKSSGTDANSLKGAYLVKLGNEDSQLTRGKMYIFHNTSLQPPAFAGNDLPSSGAQAGIIFTSNKKQQQNITSRNNLIQTRSDNNWAIKDTQLTWSNDYDYDMFNGKLMLRDGGESNGIRAYPVYERAPDGRLWLVPGTPGHDAGVHIPNFNDDFSGTAPDMGAVEANSKAPKPLHWPAFPTNYSPALNPVVEAE